jgi:hypothetical protein
MLLSSQREPLGRRWNNIYATFSATFLLRCDVIGNVSSDLASPVPIHAAVTVQEKDSALCGCCVGATDSSSVVATDSGSVVAADSGSGSAELTGCGRRLARPWDVRRETATVERGLQRANAGAGMSPTSMADSHFRRAAHKRVGSLKGAKEVPRTTMSFPSSFLGGLLAC